MRWVMLPPFSYMAKIMMRLNGAILRLLPWEWVGNRLPRFKAFSKGVRPPTPKGPDPLETRLVAAGLGAATRLRGGGRRGRPEPLPHLLDAGPQVVARPP